MGPRFKIMTIAATLAVGTSGAAMAQTACPAGYAYYNGVCQPVAAPAPAYPSGPLSGAAAGGASGAAAGNAAAGPVGGIVGGAVGTATGAIGGTANMLTGAVAPAPAAPQSASMQRCGPGMVLYLNACYPDVTGFYTMRETGYPPGS
jgi:hypothetical protein